jgi:hypothetical protein
VLLLVEIFHFQPIPLRNQTVLQQIQTRSQHQRHSLQHLVHLVAPLAPARRVPLYPQAHQLPPREPSRFLSTLRALRTRLTT